MKKILIDECLPRKFKTYFPAYDCITVPEAGWAGKKNGELLSLAENAGFQVFISLDAGIQYEQNLTGRRIAIILIAAVSSRLQDLLLHVQSVLAALESIEAGQLVRIP